MRKRNFQPRTDELGIPDATTTLPIDEPAAVYYRQSTFAQVGNVSTDMQTIDMKEYLKQRGWQEDQILMIDMDEGVSGTKKIDERPGMRSLFGLITEKKIRAVACQDEDRLFRDVTQIQVNIFIQACKDARVLVITPGMIYDFAHEQLGAFHARQFRFKCEMAAEYINTVIIGKLHRAKERVMREGRWAGARIPLGYMVDIRGTLPDGSDNPNWHKFVPFEPFAEVVRAYFRIFIESGGYIGEALRRIHQERIFLPDPDSCRPPESYEIYYHLRHRGDGYYPGRSGLWTILTNPAYIGHWCFQGVIVRWNNHPAIVPVEQFMQAFNYLSEYNLDGKKNQGFRPVHQNARPSLDSERPVARPLCAGLMYAMVKGEWRQVGTAYVAKSQYYCYELYEKAFPNNKPLWQRNAEWIDDAISRHFHNKLRATFNTGEWKQTIATFTEKLEHERKLKRAHISTFEAAKQNLIAGVETSSNPRFIQELEARYEAMEQEQQRHQAELEAMENDHRQYEALRSLQGTFADAIARWELMSRDEKHGLLQMFVDRIEVLEVKRLGKMRFRIYWREGSEDELRVNKMPTKGDAWTQEDIDRLIALVEASATQLEVAKTFPARRWRQITVQIRKYCGSVIFSPVYLSRHETYSDFLARGGNTETDKRISNAHHWTEDAISLLRQLVERNATQLEIMAAFPYRRWDHIRRTIKKVYGERSIRVSLTRGVTGQYTYPMYQAEHLTMSSVGSSLSFPAVSNTARWLRTRCI